MERFKTTNWGPREGTTGSEPPTAPRPEPLGMGRGGVCLLVTGRQVTGRQATARIPLHALRRAGRGDGADTDNMGTVERMERRTCEWGRGKGEAEQHKTKQALVAVLAQELVPIKDRDQTRYLLRGADIKYARLPELEKLQWSSLLDYQQHSY